MNCEICNKYCTTKGTLTSHIKKDHPTQATAYSKADKATVFMKEYGTNTVKGLCSVCKVQEFHALTSGWCLGHIISTKNGGTSNAGNLKPICTTCNLAMGSKNWYDYLIEKGLPVPDDVRKQQTIFDFKDARYGFEQSYSKILKKIDIRNKKYEKATTFLLSNLSDLSLLANDADYHNLFLKKIFNYIAIKEDYSRASLNNYFDTMCERDDKDSFRLIASALKMIVGKKQLPEEMDDIVKQTQLSYLGYLCMICGNERKRRMAAEDIMKSYQLKLTTSMDVLSLSFYTIEDDDLNNSDHGKYKKLYDLFGTYI